MISKLCLLLILLVSSLTLANRSEAASSNLEKATFAGGCFWCIEAVYQDINGVSEAISGFIGGTLKNPSYSGNHSGHYEAVEVTYDPSVISYQALLDLYWVNIDPFDNEGQFCDKGPSYRSAIFVNGPDQKKAATVSREAVSFKFPDDRVYTEILDSTKFYPVEEYHQDYYKKNPLRYKFYRTGCRRDNRLNEIWGDAASH